MNKDKFVKAEIKRVTDSCIKLYPNIPDFSHGTSAEGFREVRWPGVTVVFSENSRASVETLVPEKLFPAPSGVEERKSSDFENLFPKSSDFEKEIGRCSALCYSRMEKLSKLRSPDGEVRISPEESNNCTKYKLWIPSDFEKLLKYINKNVFYHKSVPVSIVKYGKDEKIYAKSFSGFTVKKELTTGSSDEESDEKDDEKIKEILKEYGKTLASVVFSKWQTI